MKVGGSEMFLEGMPASNVRNTGVLDANVWDEIKMRSTTSRLYFNVRILHIYLNVFLIFFLYISFGVIFFDTLENRIFGYLSLTSQQTVETDFFFLPCV